MGPWSRGREVTRVVQRSSTKPEKKLVFSHRGGIENFVACFLHSSAQMCLNQTPGRRPPPITVRSVNTVTKGWVGAPNGRAPFRFRCAVVVFVDRCLSRSRNLVASSKYFAEFSQADLGPRSAQECFFSGFLKSLKLFFRRFVLMASGTEIFWRVSLNSTFLWKHRLFIVTCPMRSLYRKGDLEDTRILFFVHFARIA